ncbi:bifunctional hydroxymethylpyrimidine kinase/phosphomethylpyrimidine kinase [Sodalis-like secondary symbiont of Drepanosiphum platanoidis]|uniref:bifunctional hydroxymethylpyrimidine kinase/phosphomethylpyrimidine kinase n=1 Tax=Sodalis-like secondary symbiont of Drepanosiphum platanoidis TaxID=2994493 RepID=UPI00346440F7
MKKIFNVLTIAGSDPSGGAGIQADIKTFSALGSYGASVITSLVAQNTQGVQSIFPVSTNCFSSQLNSVLTDLSINSIKIGMLGNSDIIYSLYEKIKKFNIPILILDTVILSKSGHYLLKKDSINLLKKILFPIVSVITPNLIESSIILECSVAKNEKEMIDQGKKLIKLGCKAVIMKGGHLKSKKSSPDWFITKNKKIRFNSPRIKSNNTHGTGCSFSSAIAVNILNFNNWSKAIISSKKWIEKSIINSNKLNVGKGIGPIHHYHEWW